jgi:hypothetical protein
MFKLDKALRSAKSSMTIALILTMLNLVILFMAYLEVFAIDLSFPFSVFSIPVNALWSYIYLTEGYFQLGYFHMAMLILMAGCFVGPLLLIDQSPKLLIVAALAYVADTIYMIYFYETIALSSDWIVDLIFHGWVLFTIVLAIIATFRAPKAESDPFNTL